MADTVTNDALEILGQYENLPRLVVIDLDYTLWPFYCECNFHKESPYLYTEAKGVLRALKKKGINVAVASRSPTANVAKTFLRKLGILPMFVAMEIYSSWTHKTEHLQRIHWKTGVPFNSMLFFDDENRNVEAVSTMGVTSILVDNGVNLDALRQGLSAFSQKFDSSNRSKKD
ncbi:Magnesium-dependent phosphatase-1 [Melia azedarach]|uniref:Magnesium-dependent phosphatase-1 n=1 Tax=Melia azedarach TaxID=155640 RepID=A0ACC1XV11_MELAZ|nr:Magnesium-dependent phosphatase-1 [Melia azedarach]